MFAPTVVADGFRFGEGPRWHDGRLWFTDGPSGHVLTLDEDGRLEVAVECDQASGLGWRPDGTLVISALMAARLTFVAPDGARTDLDLSHLAWSTNDMVAGPHDRVYVDLYSRGDDGLAGAIGLVSANGEAR